MTKLDPTLTTPPRSAADEQVASRARQMYAQYAENNRATGVGPAPKPAPRRRASRRGTRPERGPAVALAPSHEEIARLAYLLYEQSGRPHGRDVEFWLEAERQLVNARED